MFGVRILMLLSRATDDNKIDTDTKWKDGEIIIQHNFGYEINNVEEITEIDARIGVQNYMDQTFFGGEVSEFEHYQTLLHNRECRIIVRSQDKEEGADSEGSEGFLRLWFEGEGKMRQYEPEAIRLSLHLDKGRYDLLIRNLARTWDRCVVQARIFAIDDEGRFDKYVKEGDFNYTREIKLRASCCLRTRGCSGVFHPR